MFFRNMVRVFCHMWQGHPCPLSQLCKQKYRPGMLNVDSFLLFDIFQYQFHVGDPTGLDPKQRKLI